MPRPPLLTGLPPLLGQAPRVLVLGSMPGAASLAAGEYYAHPRNAFWTLAGEALGFDPAASYDARTAALRGAGVALWDVIGACRREGSLDSSIDPKSIRVNAIPDLIGTEATIARVLTNGGLASRLFVRHVLDALPRSVEVRAMPSTSPANASWSMERKRSLWRTALRP